MYGKSARDQARSGLTGGGALSHVYIQYPPLWCSIPGSKGIYYDDGNKLLLSPTSDQVFSWNSSQLASLGDAPSCDSINEGPLLGIRYSLDGKVIAIQRSAHVIEFKNKEKGESFTRKFKESDNILGFFWTDCPTCDIVIIKTSGLDWFSYESDLETLRLVETKRLNISWYVYTHESRLVLLASGMQCKTFVGFQFSSGGIIRLPRFEMTVTKSEANQKPVLAAGDIHIVTIYGRIYCLQVDSIAMATHLYRFYRDAVVEQGSLPMYSLRIAVSVVDNVLLIHQVDAKVVILYDIFSSSQASISAPLPLLLRGGSNCDAASSQILDAETTAGSSQEEIMYADGWTFLVPDLICDNIRGTLWRMHLDLEAIATSSSEAPFILEFLQRRRLGASKAKLLSLSIMRSMILEKRPITMISVAMDVLVAAYSQSVKTGSLLQGGNLRTSSSDSGTIAMDEVASSVDTYGKSVQPESFGGGKNVPLNPNKHSTSDSDDAEADSRSNNSGEFSGSGSKEENVTQGASGASSCRDVERSGLQSEVVTSSSLLGSTISESQGSEVASAAISPDEMFYFVFAIVEEEMTADPAYLVAIIVEYFRSATSEKLKVHPRMYVMTMQLLARSERYAELGLFIINKIIEPSKEVALQLLESGRHQIQIRKLALDMLRQLGLHDDYVLLLVQDGYYLEAVRYARKNKINTIQPSVFLEAALSSNNPQHLAAVLRCLSEFLPGFVNTDDHARYIHVLKEMI